MIRAILSIAIILLVSTPLFGENEITNETTLSYDKGEVSGWERLEVEAARVEFSAVKSWTATYVTGLEVYLKKYGAGYNPDRTFVTFVVQNAEEKVLWQKLIPFSYLPQNEGWAEIETDVILVKDKFFVTVYPYARQDFGVELGYTEGSTSFRSYRGNPSKGFKRVEKNYDWMIRAKVRSTVQPRRTITTSEISGSDFIYYDDGSADGFATFQRGGALVGFKKDGVNIIRDIYFYGKVEGNWFEAKPKFRVYLLDNDLRIITSTIVDYSVLTEIPHWTIVDFPDTRVRGDFYVLIEPGSRPQYSLHIGYDLSRENKHSYAGTIGRLKKLDVEDIAGFGVTVFNLKGEPTDSFVNRWPVEIDPKRVNWLIRVRYD